MTAAEEIIATDDTLERAAPALPAGVAPRGATRPRKKMRRALVALAAGLVVALLAGEGALRFLLFGNSELAKRLGKRWRRMELYTDSMDADYWKLQSLFNRDLVSDPPGPDPVVGWTGSVTPRTYGHPDEAGLAGRTPVLFFGDSNAECRTGPDECFQGLMERSEFASQYALLNYGVGGYGLDQIQRLVSVSLDHYADQHPIVIVSFMVDDDLERSMLPFRCWAKPRYGVKDGKLVDPPPVDVDTNHYLDENPPSIASYLYRLARSPFRTFEYEHIGTAGEMKERRELNRAVLERIRDDLERRHLRYFFLVFQMEGVWGGSKVAQWGQEVFDAFAAEHHVPYVTTRPFMEAATGGRVDGLGELIGRNDPVLMNHLNSGGNRVVFEAIRQGLEGRFGDYDLERVRKQAKEGAYRPELPHNLYVLGAPAGFEGKSEYACVRYRKPDGANPVPRLAMRCGDDGVTRLEIDVERQWKSFRARVRAVGAGDAACKEGKLVLFTRTDSNPWVREEFSIGDPQREWTLETAGAKQLEMRLEYAGADPACPWLLMDDLRHD